MEKYRWIYGALALAVAALALTTAIVNARKPSPPSPSELTSAAAPSLPEPIVYVAADPADPANYDIIYMSTGGITTNLSAQVDIISPTAGNPLFGGATIDNHSVLSPDGRRIAFASDRIDGENVDLWLMDVVTSNSAVTVTGVTRLTDGPQPERHPHFFEDGRRIVFDAKRKCGPLKPSSCSQPSLPPECTQENGDPGNFYEGMYILDLNTMTESPLLDPAAADPSWPGNSNEGHASLLPDGSRIIFGADRGLGDEGWEVFAADYLSATQTLTDLVRLSETPGQAMSGGGVFSHHGDQVFFNSTATDNSQLYRITDTHLSVPPSPPGWDQVTDNCDNDYVPEHLGDDRLLFTRQVYPDPTNPDVYDLDVWAKDISSGAETNLTDDSANDQTLLLGDEVVCFCGGPPNTSGCYLPRVWTLCSVRQMRLIVEDRYTGPIEIPPDYAQRLADYWNYLGKWARRYWEDPEHPGLQHRAWYVWQALQYTADSWWDPAWCDVQVVLPGFMPPKEPEIIDTEIVALSLSGQTTPLRVKADDEYCDGCLDFRFGADGGSFDQNLFLDQRPVVSDSTTAVTPTWRAPVVTQTRTFSLSVLVTDTTRLTDTAVVPVTVEPFAVTREITNTTKHRANDLHVTFAGTGGSLTDPVIVEDAPGCLESDTPGQPSVQGGNTVVITWTESTTPCVDPLEAVRIRVNSAFTPVQEVGHYWTRDGTRLPEFQGQWGRSAEWRLAADTPLKWCLVDPEPGAGHPARSWTTREITVAQAAIAEWSGEIDGITVTQGTNEDSDCDVTLRWEDDDFFRDWGSDEDSEHPIDLSNSNGYCNVWPNARGNANITPTSDFPPMEVYLNVDAPSGPWFVDPTPEDDDEFTEEGTAIPGGDADGKYDLYTIIKHEFGHCLGLPHTNAGPDNHYGTEDDGSSSPGPDEEWGTDDDVPVTDDGEVMWGGGAGHRRRHVPDAQVGFGERRHLTAVDVAAIDLMYDAESQEDPDGDGIPNADDNCMNAANAEQADSDEDGLGDACDLDGDNDMWADFEDNCPDVLNPDQADADGDGVGDACDTGYDVYLPLVLR